MPRQSSDAARRVSTSKNETAERAVSTATESSVTVR